MNYRQMVKYSSSPSLKRYLFCSRTCGSKRDGLCSFTNLDFVPELDAIFVNGQYPISWLAFHILGCYIIAKISIMRPSPILRLACGYLKRAKSVAAESFDYVLPDACIAYRPLSDRSASKLLVVQGSVPKLQTKKFIDLPELLPADALVVRNSSRVIPARLLMQKETGARAEVMLLSPVGNIDPSEALGSTGLQCEWNCFLGGRRIKPGDTLVAQLEPGGTSKGCSLAARVVRKDGQSAVVRFSVQHANGASPLPSDSDLATTGFTLRDAIEQIGHTPLPPYIKRDDDVLDKDAYQTIYADREGSVAAPTAGLHMTEKVIAAMKEKGIRFADVLLHVGAGTFAPLGGPFAGDHSMHEERTSVLHDELRIILNHVRDNMPIIALVTYSRSALTSIFDSSSN